MGRYQSSCESYVSLFFSQKEVRLSTPLLSSPFHQQFLKSLDSFLASSVEEILMNSHFLDPTSLSCLLLVVSLSCPSRFKTSNQALRTEPPLLSIFLSSLSAPNSIPPLLHLRNTLLAVSSQSGTFSLLLETSKPLGIL